MVYFVTLIRGYVLDTDYLRGNYKMERYLYSHTEEEIRKHRTVINHYFCAEIGRGF